MRLSRTLFVYFVRELSLYGSLGFLAISTLLIGQNVLRRVEEMAFLGFTRSESLVVLGCLAAMLVTYAVPVSFLLGALLAVRRLSADSEILAMRASGLGSRELLTPLLLLGLLFSALSACLTISVDHRVRYRVNSLFLSVAARGGMLEPGRFSQLPGQLLFVESRDRENRLEGVMIVDQTRNGDRSMLVFAERGNFALLEEEARIHVRLENGDVHITASGDPEHYQRIAFDAFDYSLDVSALLAMASAKERPKQMTFDELRNTLERIRAGDVDRLLDEKNAIEYEMEMHRRFALPVAPILFALLALPLGQRRAGSVRAWGALLCAVVVFGYYSLLSLAQFLAREGWLGAATALWTPNVIFLLIALALLYQARRRGDA